MDQHGKFQLTSPAFAEGDFIPERFSCKGQNYSPPLTINGIPEETDSMALILHDPDAPNGDFLHWSVWHINADITNIFENTLPDDAIQGTNSAGQIGYMGTCPPSGTHRYVFDLYALDAQLDLPNGAQREDVIQAITNHMVAHASLMGRFSADNVS